MILVQVRAKYNNAPMQDAKSRLKAVKSAATASSVAKLSSVVGMKSSGNGVVCFVTLLAHPIISRYHFINKRQYLYWSNTTL